MFFIFSKSIKSFYKKQPIIFANPRKDVICTTKIPSFGLSAFTTNFSLLMIFTYQIVGKISVAVYFFHLNSLSINCIFALLNITKNISNTSFILFLANKKVF